MRTVHTDLVVVGAGSAGLAAAVSAAEAGQSVAVLDADIRAGGTARIAGGGTLLAGSPQQTAMGIDDSVADALSDWIAWGGPTVADDWARRYVQVGIPELLRWWTALGVKWLDSVLQFEGNAVPRFHLPAGGGRQVMRLIEEQARSLPRIGWYLGARVTSLVTVGGRVGGVIAHGPTGEQEFAAPWTIVASGGFCNSLDLVTSMGPSTSTPILLGGGPGATGDGHRMLAAVGAEFVNLDAVWMTAHATRDPSDPTGRRGVILRDMEGDLWVDRHGQRFHNEALRGGTTATPALLAQPDGTAWSVIDARIAARVTVTDPAYRNGLAADRIAILRLLNESPYIHHAMSLGELAERSEIASDGLLSTVAQHNSWVDSRVVVDPNFGRPMTGVGRIAEPPFYAIQLVPLARKSLGGVRTDLACAVLRADGTAVSGLMAAGEVAGMAGGSINGRAALEGTMFAPSCYSGLVAGRSAAA